MLTPRLYLRRAARSLSRGGFTLVELLVVIGIIAILAGVALGPITNGIKKAKQSSGLQSAHALGLAMYSAANDDSQLYPDVSSGDASNIARILLAGGYVTDPGIFFLSGDTATGAAKFTATTQAASNIVQSNVSWDFLSNSGTGASSTQYTNLPIVWSTTGTTPATFTASAGSPITVALTATNPFGTDGLAIFYINNSASFVISTITGSTFNATLVTASNNTTTPPTTYKTLSGL